MKLYLVAFLSAVSCVLGRPIRRALPTPVSAATARSYLATCMPARYLWLISR
jgi:hypothetical protein